MAVETEGRHRYYRLAGAPVAEALEGLAALRPAGPVRRKALTAEGRALRFARCCYDHLAGPLGVEFMAALCAQGWLRRVAASRAVEITPKGHTALRHHLGVDVEALRQRSAARDQRPSGL